MLLIIAFLIYFDLALDSLDFLEKTPTFCSHFLLTVKEYLTQTTDRFPCDYERYAPTGKFCRKASHAIEGVFPRYLLTTVTISEIST
jgi:hypothetical protein